MTDGKEKRKKGKERRRIYMRDGNTAGQTSSITFLGVLAVSRRLRRIMMCALITHTQRAATPGALLQHRRSCRCLRPAWQPARRFSRFFSLRAECDRNARCYDFGFFGGLNYDWRSCPDSRNRSQSGFPKCPAIYFAGERTRRVGGKRGEVVLRITASFRVTSNKPR